MIVQEQERRTATADDQTLIDLCGRAEAIGIHIDAAIAEMTDEITTSDRLRPFYDEIDDLDRKIRAMQPHTIAGLRAKARRVLWHRCGNFLLDELQGCDQKLAFHIIRDLLRM